MAIRVPRGIDLDPRSLACLRLGTAAVLAWDLLGALRVADDWWDLQGYGEPKLPAWLTLGSQALTLQLAASGLLVVAVLLALGWRTRATTAVAWAGACAFQFAARSTADYHDAVLCVLLFWSLALPTGQVVSLDARTGRRAVVGTRLARVAGAGLLLNVAWIYLTTAAAKTGPAWWSEGSAVWLALLDRGTPTAAGRWLAVAAPASVWPPLTHAVLCLEWAAPALLLWRRTRTAAVLALGAMHAAMWPLLALGTFPPVMLTALAALLPGSAWDRLGWRASPRLPAARPTSRADRWLAGAMALALLITAEGERVVAWEGDRAWPYPGARQVARLRYLLGMEVVWGMYAPEPFRDTGWWVAIGWRADGTTTDPITGRPPTLAPPPPTGPGADLRWRGLSDAPSLAHGWGVQAVYRNLLLARRNGSGTHALRRLALVWVHEPLVPFRPPEHREPLLILAWPDGAADAAAVAAALGAPVYEPAYDDSTGRLLGPLTLNASGGSLP